MEKRYTINQLSTICKVSVQSIYKLFSKNQPLVKEHSTRQGRKILYGQEVLDFLLSYYSNKSTSTDTPTTPQETPTVEVEDNSTNDKVEALKAKIEVLEARIEELEKQLEAKEAERQELLKQNGAILLVLTQERQELDSTRKLLPPPKMTIGERISNLFRRH